MQLERKRFPRWNIVFKTLAWYQIIGGLIGYGVLVWHCAQLTSVNTTALLLLIGAVVLYGFSIYCGVLILKKPAQGLQYSFVNQLLQTVHIGWYGYVFKYNSGLTLSLTWLPFTDSTLSFNIEFSRLYISINAGGDIAFIGINLFAIFLSYYLLHVREAYADALLEKEITDIADIGHN